MAQREYREEALMKILVAVGVLMLIAYVIVKAERSPYYPPPNGGTVMGVTVTPDQIRGLGTGQREDGCLTILAVIGLLSLIAAILWVTGIL